MRRDPHNKLAARSPGIEDVLVPDSRHYIQNDDPQKVISAIEHVLLLTRDQKMTGGLLA